MHLALRCLLIVATGYSLLGWGLLARLGPRLAAPACGQDRPLIAPGQRPVAEPGRVGRLQQPRVAAVGDVRLSISIRQTTSKQPRFVMAFRTVEENEPQAEFQTPAEIVKYFTVAAEAAIEDIDRLCQLDDKQKAKLKLAAMGDMSRLAREAREVHDQFAGTSPRNQEHMLAVSAELTLLNASLKEGVFRAGSMFSRVLASSLSREQTTRLVTARFSEQLDQWSLKLTDRQRKQLVDVMFAYSQRLVEPIVWWESRQCAALLKHVAADELETLLEPWQLQIIHSLREEPFPLHFRPVGP